MTLVEEINRLVVKAIKMVKIKVQVIQEAHKMEIDRTKKDQYLMTLARPIINREGQTLHQLEGIPQYPLMEPSMVISALIHQILQLNKSNQVMRP